MLQSPYLDLKMKSKLKECDACGKQSIIWKNHEGFRYTFEKRINSLTAWKDKHFFKPFKQQKQ
jgi:hypothetical protein